MAVAAIAAVSWLLVTNVVGAPVPFQFTTALLAKLLPLTVKVNAGPPTCALSGDSSVILGTIPGCGALFLCELYPHAAHCITSQSTQIVFMTLPTFRGSVTKGNGTECQLIVIFM